jgi:hypothetical protein
MPEARKGMNPVYIRVAIGIFSPTRAVFTRARRSPARSRRRARDPLDQNGIDRALRFDVAFGCDDELFEVRFDALDGVGTYVGDEGFTRARRALPANGLALSNAEISEED